MGYSLMNALIDAYNLTVRAAELKATKVVPKVPKNGGDFWMILITRNMYHALISGYLYHKTGCECWLGANGQPASISHVRAEHSLNWENNLLAAMPPVVPRIGRIICKYLAEESEQDGLWAFIEFSLGTVWYWKLLLQFYKLAF
jgi:hypothetical protein